MTPIFSGVTLLVGIAYGLLIAWGGFILAVLIIGTLLKEKRKPSNIFAWSMAVLLMPYVGVPLYFLFGGRKSKRLVRQKVQFMSRALQETGAENLRSFSLSVQHGNNCELLGDGLTAYAAFMREIEAAQECIQIMTYILSNDESGNAIVKALTRRVEAGVTVHLLIDSFGSLTNRSRALREFVAAGGQFARFMPLLPLHSHHSANLRNHRKLAIFDRHTVITGGQNLDRHYLAATQHPELFEDFSMLIRGPIVQAFSLAFFSDWSFARKSPPAEFSDYLRNRPEPCGDYRIELIESGPEFEDDTLYETMLGLIYEAKRSVTIVTPYFVPDETLLRALLVKAHRGCLIRLILPRRSNHRFVDFARYHLLRQLHRAGADIQLYMPRMLHAKLMLIDDEIALTGSANFDMRSLFVNFEIGLLHSSQEDVNTLTQWAQNLIPHCLPFSEIFDEQPNLGRRIAENLAHLTSPLL